MAVTLLPTWLSAWADYLKALGYWFCPRCDAPGDPESGACWECGYEFDDDGEEG